MDDADRTQEREEAEAPFRVAKSRKPELPPARGTCFWCDEPTAPGARYCSFECAADHGRALRAKTVGGFAK